MRPTKNKPGKSVFRAFMGFLKLFKQVLVFALALVLFYVIFYYGEGLVPRWAAAMVAFVLAVALGYFTLRKAWVPSFLGAVLGSYVAVFSLGGDAGVLGSVAFLVTVGFVAPFLLITFVVSKYE